MRWLFGLLLLLWSAAPHAAEPDHVTLLYTAEKALEERSAARAVALFSRALNGTALSPGQRVAAYNNRAIAFRRLGQQARAKQDYLQAAALAPQDSDLMFNRAVALLTEQRFDEGIAELTRLLAQRPDDAMALYLRGLAELARQRPDGAVDDLSAAVGYASDMAEAYYARGRAYATLAQHDLAVEDFDTALRLSPDLAPALLGRGYSHSGQGQHDLAARDYTAAIARLPEEATVYRYRADVYRRLGRYDQAITDYSQAVLLDPSVSDSFGGRALAWQRLEQYDKAIVDYSQAILLDPGLASAHKARGAVRFYLGQYAEAARDFEQGLALASHDVYANLWLYLSRQRAGIDGREQLSSYASTLNLARWPGPVITLFLGEMDVGAVLDAAKHDDRRRQREMECEAFFYVGEYYLLRGDRKRAARFFQRSVLAGITSFKEYAGAKAEIQKLAP